MKHVKKLYRQLRRNRSTKEQAAPDDENDPDNDASMKKWARYENAYVYAGEAARAEIRLLQHLSLAGIAKYVNEKFGLKNEDGTFENHAS